MSLHSEGGISFDKERKKKGGGGFWKNTGGGGYNSSPFGKEKRKNDRREQSIFDLYDQGWETAREAPVEPRRGIRGGKR